MCYTPPQPQDTFRTCFKAISHCFCFTEFKQRPPIKTNNKCTFIKFSQNQQWCKKTQTKQPLMKHTGLITGEQKVCAALWTLLYLRWCVLHCFLIILFLVCIKKRFQLAAKLIEFNWEREIDELKTECQECQLIRCYWNMSTRVKQVWRRLVGCLEGVAEMIAWL